MVKGYYECAYGMKQQRQEEWLIGGQSPGHQTIIDKIWHELPPSPPIELSEH